MYKNGLAIRKDLTDKKFGSLVVLFPFKKIKHGTLWRCICECGNITDVLSYHLLSKHTKSCGCLSKLTQYKKQDITNMSFGRLKVMSCLGKKNTSYVWLCQCNCGNYKECEINELNRGNIKSCGCLVNSTESKEKSKITCLKKYGYEYASQNSCISLKIAKSGRRVYVLNHWKTNEEIICVGSWEKKVVEYFNNNKINFEWQSKVFKMPNGKTYRPDCYLSDQDLWVEIKGYMRSHSKIKWGWFHEEHSNSELWDKKKLKELKIL